MSSVIIRTDVPIWARRLAMQYREQVLDALKENIDNIRKTAASSKYIIPRDPSLPRTYNTYQMTKKQPSHPTKLTERTGALIRMLREPHTWKSTKRSRVSTGGAVFGQVKVATKGQQVGEEYDAFIKLDVKSPKSFSRLATAQQLRLRFMHDTPGIRGRVRAFYTPAAKEENINLSPLIERKLRMIGAL